MLYSIDLRYVLVGTALEVVCFVCQVPTGVLADVYSRRLSVIADIFILGAGFILEGSIPLFATIVVGQALFGVGATFMGMLALIFTFPHFQSSALKLRHEKPGSLSTMMFERKQMFATKRLQLIPFSLDLMKATMTGKVRLGELLEVEIPTSWPGPDLAEALPFFVEEMEKDSSEAAWNWLIVLKAERVIIGDIGFMGGPNEEGIAEIGYSTVPEYRDQGYATEAADGLIHWAFQQHEVKVVTASCLNDNIGSIKVLEKVGMHHLEPDGNLLKWEIRKEK